MDREDVSKVEDVESLAVVSDDEEEVKEGVVEEVKEEVIWESRLLCSSPSPQLARQLHSENKIIKRQFLPVF